MKNKHISSTTLAMETICLTLLFVALLYAFVEPRWETNDDVGMSMVSHGYGLANEPSPTLIFSNVLWGYVTSSFPVVMEIPGYSALSLSALMFAGGVIYFGIVKFGNGRLLACFICLLVLARPFVFPQFTLTSGLLAVAGFVSLSLFLVERHWAYLIVTLIASGLSFLIREQEFFLVALIASTLLPLRTVGSDRALIFSACAFALFVILATYVNTVSYSQDSWLFFKELNPLRAAFTDFNVAQAVQAHPDVLARYGHTQNDINLLENWFFADKRIANPAAIQNILADIGATKLRHNYLEEGISSVKALYSRRLIPVLLSIVALALIFKSKRLLVAITLLVTLAFVIGALGRPGTLRIYEPLTALLVVAPFLTPKFQSFPWKSAVSVLAVAAVFASVKVIKTSIKQQNEIEVQRDILSKLPGKEVVVWGSTFPYEAVYPVLDTVNFRKTVKLYALGAFTWAPFSVAYSMHSNQNGMIESLVKETGVWILAADGSIGLLEIYCSENFAADLEEVETLTLEKKHLGRFRCLKQEPKATD